MDRKAMNANARVLQFIGSMTAVELSEFVAAFKSRFSVGGLANAAAEYERSTAPKFYNIDVTDHGERKIQVIKAIREVTRLPLKEAKEASEGTQHSAMTKVPSGKAHEIAAAIQAEGATVKLTEVAD